MKPREPCAGRNAASGFVQLKNKFIMGHFSLDFKKAKGSSDARESDHIERKVIPDNIIRKAKRWFPMLEAYLQIESLCKRIGFTAEQISVLLAGKALNFSGSLYSEKHRRKFNVENAEIKVFSDSTKPNQLFLCINRQPIVEWFKEQWNISKDRRTLNPKINKEEKI